MFNKNMCELYYITSYQHSQLQPSVALPQVTFH